MKQRILLALAATLAIAGLGWLGRPYLARDVVPDRPVAERPTLALLTSLPLVFGEEFSLQVAGSPALTRLEQRYRVEAIAVADTASLREHKLLLMAQPRAQPAEALVDLDQWVRAGGHLLLLADPRLEWPSKRPLGDVLRPPPMFADTGLLAHWGLALSAPGSLKSSGACRIAEGGLIARCRIGKGQATIIADADFLNVEDPGAPWLDPLIAELSRLETR